MVKKITIEEFNKIKEDVKSGKIKLDDLYKKAGVCPPYMVPYEFRHFDYRNLSKEDYGNLLKNGEIEFVLEHLYSYE